jgi:menaquinone-dependent protoporphyrinogen oxidase
MNRSDEKRHVLVTAASRHGATEEIAQRIAEHLREDELVVVTSPPSSIPTVDEFDVVVLGSAVYAGHWMEEAKELAKRLANTSPQPEVWLFSSGPLGDPPKPDVDPVDVAEVMAVTRARDHKVFAGRLDRTRLGIVENTVVAALKVPEGDFRDWEVIESWAKKIALSI